MTDSTLQSVESCLANIEAMDGRIRAFITVAATRAREEAKRIDGMLAAGRALTSAGGCVVSIKDNIDVGGLATTCGSAKSFHTLPNRDSTVAARLAAAGAVTIGKVNLHEFAFGGTTQNPHHGPCRNPWDTDRIPGGSSGGSGASVAAGMCAASLGSDTGGSIRIPAALNGVVGLRPTVGRVPNTGSTPVSPRFDTIGPLAHDVTTVAAVYEAIAGHDPADPISAPQPVESFLSAVTRGMSGLRIGVPESFFFEGLDADLALRMEEAIALFGKLGAQIVAIDLPDAGSIQSIMTPMLLSDAADYHRAALEDAGSGLGADIRERMMIGYNASGPDYARAMRAKERWARSVANAFETVDAIITPTVNGPAPLAEASQAMIAATKDLTRFTFVWSFAEVPALSVPCGFTRGGLPLGLQLVGPWWSEARLLALGHFFQQETDYHLRRPRLLAKGGKA
jgi:aspartyl-tRNA(Asn)/glutamyl-tRNA(Gln) amidotransferase subunit A